MEYDSSTETLRHIRRVNQLLITFACRLLERAAAHDDSKLLEPEKSGFDKVTQKLRGMTYGSEEYKQSLEELKPILDHHYAVNSHHPEHWQDGIRDMDLLDLVEMFFDWKAATERHADGSILKSIAYNKNRFNYSDDIESIFKNTAHRLALV